MSVTVCLIQFSEYLDEAVSHQKVNYDPDTEMMTLYK